MAEWKLVPVEPTREMIDAGHMHTMRADEEEPYRARGEAIACYSDMLSAAPQAPSGQQAEPTAEQIEKLAVKHESFGFGQVDAKGFTTHGFDPDGLKAFVRDLLALAAQQAERPAHAPEHVVNRRGELVHRDTGEKVGWPKQSERPAPAGQAVVAWPDALPKRVAVSYSPNDWDTFIYGVSGHLTMDALAAIEKQILDDDDAAALFDKGPGDYLLSASRFIGQYGPEGQCEFAPGWELDVVEFRALAASQAERPAVKEDGNV
jgi:hypothetical protein